MVDTLRLALNASDVKLLTGWPDAMVEDYIQILADLTAIIDDLNQALIDIAGLFNDDMNINSDLQGVRSIVAQVRAKINRLDKQVLALTNTVNSLVTLNVDVSQQLADATIAKVRSRVFSSVKDYKAWLPAKGTLLTIEGQGASNPLVTNDYNVASVTRTAPGVYEVTVSQETYFTRNVLSNSVFTHSNVIDPLTSSFNIEVVVTGATTFEIRVYEMVVVGASVQRGAYDLLAGHFVSVTALFSINDTLPPR